MDIKLHVQPLFPGLHKVNNHTVIHTLPMPSNTNITISLLQHYSMELQVERAVEWRKALSGAGSIESAWDRYKISLLHVSFFVALLALFIVLLCSTRSDNQKKKARSHKNKKKVRSYTNKKHHEACLVFAHFIVNNLIGGSRPDTKVPSHQLTCHRGNVLAFVVLKYNVPIIGQ